MIAEQTYSRRTNKRAFSIFLTLCLMLSLLAQPPDGAGSGGMGRLGTPARDHQI